MSLIKNAKPLTTGQQKALKEGIEEGMRVTAKLKAARKANLCDCCYCKSKRRY